MSVGYGKRLPFPDVEPVGAIQATKRDIALSSQFMRGRLKAHAGWAGLPEKGYKMHCSFLVGLAISQALHGSSLFNIIMNRAFWSELVAADL